MRKLKLSDFDHSGCQAKSSSWVTFSEHKAMRLKSQRAEQKFNRKEDCENKGEDEEEKHISLFAQVKINKPQTITEMNLVLWSLKEESVV